MIYLVHAPDLGLVKIGHSNDVQSRFCNLQTASPVELVLLASREGGQPLEAAIHRALVSHRVRGEWFAYCLTVTDAFHQTQLSDTASTHAEVVSAIGLDTIANTLALSINTVAAWRFRDSIPGEHWLAFRDNEWATLEVLATAAAARKVAA
jgi:hypothetical protein